jgi:hypothetical protein
MDGLFNTLNLAYANIYNPLENLAVDEVNCKIQGQDDFQVVHSKEKKIYNYKLCDKQGYTHNTRVYLGKDSRSATVDMTATHATLRHLTCRVEGLGHKTIYGHYFFMIKTFR